MAMRKSSEFATLLSFEAAIDCSLKAAHNEGLEFST